jgi:hypothetical protein
MRSFQMPSQNYFAASDRSSLLGIHSIPHRHSLNHVATRPSVFEEETLFRQSPMNQAKGILLPRFLL